MADKIRRPATELAPSPALFELIRMSEAEGGVPRLKAYLCPAGIWTIGFGTTKDVRPGDTLTAAEAETLMRVDVFDSETYVRRQVRVPLTQGEYDGLVSFVHNIRKNKWNEQQCTLLRKLNAGDYEGSAMQFRLWVNGMDPKLKRLVKLPGLVIRRRKEEALFRS